MIRFEVNGFCPNIVFPGAAPVTQSVTHVIKADDAKGACAKFERAHPGSIGVVAQKIKAEGEK